MSGPAAVGAVIGFGVAGLDPFGALIVIPALVAGGRRRLVVVFAAAALLGTVLVGVLLGESIQAVIGVLRDFVDVPLPVRSVLQLVAAAGLAFWAALRWRRRAATPAKRKHSPLHRPVGMAAAGLLWGASALLDPTFYGVTVIGAQLPGVPALVLAFTGWFLVSQAPLCLVVLALVAGRDSRLVRNAIAVARWMVQPARHLMTAGLALGSVLLVASSVGYLVAGQFWPF